MILPAVILILIIFFFATRYGIKSKSKNVRIASYLGAFLAFALLTLLTVLEIARGFGN